MVRFVRVNYLNRWCGCIEIHGLLFEPFSYRTHNISEFWHPLRRNTHLYFVRIFNLAMPRSFLGGDHPITAKLAIQRQLDFHNCLRLDGAPVVVINRDQESTSAQLHTNIVSYIVSPSSQGALCPRNTFMQKDLRLTSKRSTGKIRAVKEL